MIPLPQATTDPNIRALSRLECDRRTGVASALWKLSARPIQSHLWVYKNGLLLDPAADYTVQADTITFAVPLIAGDKTVATFYTRAA